MQKTTIEYIFDFLTVRNKPTAIVRASFLLCTAVTFYSCNASKSWEEAAKAKSEMAKAQAEQAKAQAKQAEAQIEQAKLETLRLQLLQEAMQIKKQNELLEKKPGAQVGAVNTWIASSSVISSRAA